MKPKQSVLLALGAWVLISGIAAYCILINARARCSDVTLDFSNDTAVVARIGPWKVRFHTQTNLGEPRIEAKLYCPDDTPLDVSAQFWADNIEPVEARVVNGGAATNLTPGTSEFSVTRMYWIELPKEAIEQRLGLCCELVIGTQAIRLQVKV